MTSDTTCKSATKEPGLHGACLGLGSNVAPAANLAAAVQRLRLLFPVQAVSSAWQSQAVGVEASDYVNAALLVRTTLAKHDLIALLKRAEYDLGRTRILGESTHVPIDIDLLVFDGVVQKADMWDLAYRAIPVAELLPDLASPESGESLSAAASRLSSETRIDNRPDILRDATRPVLAVAVAADKDALA
jgi:2-amino-4-hydroxy-6-hydroxymethyldihydropteridine diphosphokinase